MTVHPWGLAKSNQDMAAIRGIVKGEGVRHGENKPPRYIISCKCTRGTVVSSRGVDRCDRCGRVGETFLVDRGSTLGEDL